MRGLFIWAGKGQVRVESLAKLERYSDIREVVAGKTAMHCYHVNLSGNPADASTRLHMITEIASSFHISNFMEGLAMTFRIRIIRIGAQVCPYTCESRIQRLERHNLSMRTGLGYKLKRAPRGCEGLFAIWLEV